MLFAFELQMAAELEGQTVNYDTTISVSQDSYSITYHIYGAPE